MINLRYHIVSLAAVFLALALGILVGSTVIDRAIVDELRERVDSVSRRADRTDGENRELRGQLDLMEGFATEARDQLVLGRLEGVPVLVVTVQGVDRAPVDGAREALSVAGAVPAGSLLLTNRFRLESETDVRLLATALGSAPTLGADVLRRQALGRMASTLDGSNPEPALLPALAAAGFVGYEPPGGTTTTQPTLGLGSFPVPGLRVLLVSGAGAEAPDDRVALPFAQALVTSGTAAGNERAALVAAEAGHDAGDGRALFVGLVRSGSDLANRVSTVDNLESPIGQAAAVLALGDLDVPRTGSYGVGPGAQRLLPSLEP